MKKITMLAILFLLGNSAFAAESTPPFLAAVKTNGQWGAIDANGKMIIPPSYKEIGLSLLDERSRTADLESEERRKNFIEVRSGKEYGFYDRKGHVIIPVSYRSRSLWKEERIAVANKNNEVTFYTTDGRKLSTTTYDETSDFTNGMALVKKNGKYGYVSADGSVISPKYKEANLFSEGYATVRDGSLWGVIDTTGTYVIKPQYKEVGETISAGLLAVKSKDQQWGFVNTKNEVIVPLIYRDVEPTFSEGATAVQNDKKLWGFVDTEGNTLAKPMFDAVYDSFSQGLAPVKTKDGKAYARQDGTIAFMADFDKIYGFKNGLAEFREGQYVPRHRSGFQLSFGFGWGSGNSAWFGPHHRWFWGFEAPFWLLHPWYDDYDRAELLVKRGYIDITGKIIAGTSNDAVFPATSKGIIVLNDNRYGYIRPDGLYVAHTVYRKLIPIDDADLILARDKKKEWGLLSMKEYKELTSFIYEDMTYKGNSYVAAKQNGRWKLLSRDGTVLTIMGYTEIGDYGDGLFPAKKGDQWCYIDTTGKEVLAFATKVEDATPFVAGRAGIKRNGKWALIDKDGNQITESLYKDFKFL